MSMGFIPSASSQAREPDVEFRDLAPREGTKVVVSPSPWVRVLASWKTCSSYLSQYGFLFLSLIVENLFC